MGTALWTIIVQVVVGPTIGIAMEASPAGLAGTWIRRAVTAVVAAA